MIMILIALNTGRYQRCSAIFGSIPGYLLWSNPSGLLHSSYRNIQRKKTMTYLTRLKTEKVELAFAQRGIEVLGSKEYFIEWLQSPCRR